MKVLIVDDEIINVKIASSLTRKAGAEDIDSAYDGLSAIEMCKTKEYDLVMLDYRLGNGIDGLEVTQTILNSASPAVKPKIMIISGDMSESFREKVIAAGAFDLLVKPFSVSQIKSVLESIK